VISKMTKEKAEEIVELWKRNPIASLQTYKLEAQGYLQGHADGFKEGLEAAAKISEQYPCYYNNGACGPGIAKEIRSLGELK